MLRAALSAALLLSLASAALAEPYYVTVQKLELKTEAGEWIDIIEPDHKVDLNETDASVSFFNNGRVPPGDFKNFRLSFEDRGVDRQMSRREDFATPFTVKKGSFVNVVFDIDTQNQNVKGTHLTVDAQEFVDPGYNIEVHDKKG